MLWQPKDIKESNWVKFLNFLQNKYKISIDPHDLHQWSIDHIEDFWESLAQFLELKFHKQPLRILNNADNMIESNWFQGATLNITEQYLNPKYKNNIAIISHDETGRRSSLSYEELAYKVKACKNLLEALQVKPNDRVIAIMPNTEATIIAFLATASLGAIWASCSPDFGEEALLDRFTQINPKILFTVNGYNYNGKAINITEKILNLKNQLPSLEKIVMLPYIGATLPQNVINWDLNQINEESLNYHAFPFAHPLYIMFSSGTTGKPKCIVHSVGGTLIQHLKELALHTDLSAKDNLLFFTTCGWMMWNWTISALALGSTLTLYEGSPLYPKKDVLFDLIEKEQVTVFGTSAKFITEIEKNKIFPRETHDLHTLRTILSTGSPLNASSFDYVYEKISPSVQLSSISGGTDLISCFALGSPIKPVYQGELQTLGLGMAVDIYNETGLSLDSEAGELVCTKPFPSMPIYFWNDPDKKIYYKSYFEKFPKVWAHGDYAQKTHNKGLIIHGRSDGVLNPGGVRIGTAEIYRPLNKIEEILEAVVIDQKWQDDFRIVLFVKLSENTRLTDELKQKIKAVIRQYASPRHVPKIISQVKDIPKTFNGKIMELAVRQAVHGLQVPNLHAMANPESIKEFYNKEELS